MSYPRLILVCLSVAGLMVPSVSGQTVVAIDSQTKELKRTAHQLRIPADQLRNAREALQQATELARRSSDSASISQLAQSWIRINKSKAPGAFEDLYAWLATAARDAADAATYQRLTSAAQSLLRSLATLDSERAVGLWRQWPDPLASLGPELKRVRDQVDAQFSKQLAAQASGQPMAPDLTAMRNAAAKGDFSATASLVSQLSQSGDKAEALQYVDQAVVNFRQREPDQRALSSYTMLVRQLPYIDPDRYLTALNSLLPALNKQENPNAGGTISVGNQTVEVTAAEALVLDMCRNLMGRPELAMKTLNTIPGLRSKLDRVGGIDSISGPPRGSQAPVTMNYSIDGMSRTTYSSTGTSTFSGVGPATGGSPALGPDLYQSLSGKLAKNPEFVRQKLAEAARTPDQIDALLNLARRANYQEPDLASMALESASNLVMQVEPLARRANVLQNLMSTYQSCEGEVDPDLLQKGLVIIQQLRDEEKNNPTAYPMARGGVAVRMVGMADQLEMAIVAELARENFQSALRYLRLMPDEMRLQALLRIVQSLMQPY